VNYHEPAAAAAGDTPRFDGTPPAANEPEVNRAFRWPQAARIALVLVAAIAARFRLPLPLSYLVALGAAALAIGGWPIFKEAAENLAARRMTMELSMTIAIAAAAAIGEFFTAFVITVFVLAAEVLENMTVARGRIAIRDLMEFLPRSVIVRRSGAVREVSAAELCPGDRVLVNPGALVPVDGVVLTGHSFVDQAKITGEPIPVEKSAGAAVYAGTVNQSGALEITAERIGRDTTYGRIIEAVEQAERLRAPVQRLADRLAGYLVYLALAAAALTFIVSHDIRSTISVVIVAGACGIAAGTPLAILGGIGRAAHLGAIVKGGRYLETLGQVDTVVLDKTGTLTLGRAEVLTVLPAPGCTEREVLMNAAAAEMRSEHPLGKAIVAHAAAMGLTVPEPQRLDYQPGRGIVAAVNGANIVAGNRAMLSEHGIDAPQSAAMADAGSQVMVARDGRHLGTIVIGDTIRPGTREALAALDRMSIRTLLLTGDSEANAAATARRLGINQFEADLLPDAKLARIRELVGGGRVVAMVGDGINDAPALAAASVGVAMGSGTEVARESGQVLLLGNDLARLAQTIEIARWTRRIIRQNFVGTIVVDVGGMALAACGLLNPALAAFIHVTSELTFILNSARLLPRFNRPAPSRANSISLPSDSTARAA
jgi:P-type Cu+ transporter